MIKPFDPHHRTLVVKFRRGLKTSQIATIPFGQPADTDPEAWYVATRRIDQARLTNEAFQSTLQSTTMAPTCSTLPWPTPLSMLCLSQSTLPPIPPRPAPPVPSGRRALHLRKDVIDAESPIIL